MPIHTNSIGSFTFFDLVGSIYPRQEQIEVIERPGVNGSGARKTGARGKPFVLLSITYFDDFSDAASELTSYKAYVGDALHTVTRNSVNLGDFLVLEVTEATPPMAVLNVAGSPSSQVRAEHRWRLLG